MSASVINTSTPIIKDKPRMLQKVGYALKDRDVEKENYIKGIFEEFKGIQFANLSEEERDEYGLSDFAMWENYIVFYIKDYKGFDSYLLFLYDIIEKNIIPHNKNSSVSLSQMVIKDFIIKDNLCLSLRGWNPSYKREIFISLNEEKTYLETKFDSVNKEMYLSKDKVVLPYGTSERKRSKLELSIFSVEDCITLNKIDNGETEVDEEDVELIMESIFGRAISVDIYDFDLLSIKDIQYEEDIESGIKNIVIEKFNSLLYTFRINNYGEGKLVKITSLLSDENFRKPLYKSDDLSYISTNVEFIGSDYYYSWSIHKPKMIYTIEGTDIDVDEPMLPEEPEIPIPVEPVSIGY